MNEVDDMRNPNSPLSKQQIDSFTGQYQETFNKVLPLYNSVVLREEVKQKTQVSAFVDTFRGLHNLPGWNQRQHALFSTIFQLLDNSKIEYGLLFHADHYIAGSEMDAYFDKFEPLRSSIELSQDERSFHYLTYAIQSSCQTFLSNLKLFESKRKEHNERFKKSQLSENAEYFDSILSYPLDAQQRDAIVTLEDNTQVISAAGGGKTTTIVGKIKYLIEKRGYDPASILLITYTRKATEELNRRLPFDGLNSVTFHSLAVRMIGATTGRKPSICDSSLLAKIYDSLIKTPEFLASINHYLLELMSMMKDEHQYKDSKQYFADRKKYGIKALFKDMDGNTIYTRSEQERRICNFLHCHGIQFRYEASYPFSTASYNFRQYKPDFTIYYTINGETKSYTWSTLLLMLKGKFHHSFRRKVLGLKPIKNIMRVLFGNATSINNTVPL